MPTNPYTHQFNTRLFNEAFIHRPDVEDNLTISITETHKIHLSSTDQLNIITEEVSLPTGTTPLIDTIQLSADDVSTIYEPLYHEDRHELENNTTYYYEVRTLDGQHLSDWSNTVQVHYLIGLEDRISSDNLEVGITDDILNRLLELDDSISLIITEAYIIEVYAQDIISTGVIENIPYRDITISDTLTISIDEETLIPGVLSLTDTLYLSPVESIHDRTLHIIDELAVSLEAATVIAQEDTDTLIVDAIDTAYLVRKVSGEDNLALASIDISYIRIITTDYIQISIHDNVLLLTILDDALPTLEHSTLGWSVLSESTLGKSKLNYVLI